VTTDTRIRDVDQGHQFRRHAKEIEEGLPNAEMLRLSAFQADATRSEIVWKSGILKGDVLATCRGPAKCRLITGLLDADARAVRPTQLHGYVYEFLKDALGSLGKNRGRCSSFWC
jgi:hypothetical protein